MLWKWKWRCTRVLTSVMWEVKMVYKRSHLDHVVGSESVHAFSTRWCRGKWKWRCTSVLTSVMLWEAEVNVYTCSHLGYIVESWSEGVQVFSCWWCLGKLKWMCTRSHLGYIVKSWSEGVHVLTSVMSWEVEVKVCIHDLTRGLMAVARSWDSPNSTTDCSRCPLCRRSTGKCNKTNEVRTVLISDVLGTIVLLTRIFVTMTANSSTKFARKRHNPTK